MMNNDLREQIDDYIREMIAYGYESSAADEIITMVCTAYCLKDNEVAEFVNDLTRTAQVFGQTQQLREHIRIDVLNHLNNLRGEHV